MNPWLFSFIISVVLLVTLIDWKEIATNVHGGIISAIFMFFDVALGDKHNLFEYRQVGLNLPQWILFSDGFNIFFVGIAFGMGVLILQFLPARPGWQLIYVLVWGLFLFAFLYLSKSFHLFITINFKSFFVVRQVLLFLFLAWFKDDYLGKGRIPVR